MAIENTRKYSTYSDFPFYLSEHSKKSTRLLHYGTIGYQVTCLYFTELLFLPFGFAGGLWAAYKYFL